VKERKFGAGASMRGEEPGRPRRTGATSSPSLDARGRPFLFGDAPTLPTRLNFMCKILQEADPVLLPGVAHGLVSVVRRLEERTAKADLST
jgi:hypothetical protein